MPSSTDMIEAVFRELLKEVQVNRSAIGLASQRSERAETAGGIASILFVNLPAVNVSGGDMLFCSNCRKIGEGVGAGTGQIVYYNPATATWKRISDDADAAV